MDDAVPAITRAAAATRWRRDLEGAEAGSRESWPVDITAGMSEFERLTLVTEILMPELEETRQRDRPAWQPTDDQEEDTEELNVNQVYTVILDAAAMCNRWLREDLGPGLREGGQDFETPMTLDPAADIDRWVTDRATPLPEEPSGNSDDDIEIWLRWGDLRTAGILPEDTAPRAEWSEAVGRSLALVREALHRLTLARLYMRAGDPALLEANVAVQAAENLYRVVVWLASTLQAWGQALVRLHNAAPSP